MATHPYDTRRSDQARYDAKTSTLIHWGWITAILFAPVGFVIGIVLLTRNRMGHGIGMMLVAMLITLSLFSTV